MYRYYTLHRPPMIGTIPKAGLQYVHEFDDRQPVTEIGKQAWGYAEYNRKLTDDEISAYELAYGGDNC